MKKGIIMKRILTFGASNSKNSINSIFANYVASSIEEAEIDLIDLNDFEMPIYGIDIEKKSGIPEPTVRFKDHINTSDCIVISFAEHNGHYTVAFKNIFDWLSRIDRNIWMNKPMFLLAAAPGPRGAQKVLDHAVVDMARKGGEIAGVFSLPQYRNNFSPESGILDKELNGIFHEQLLKFEVSLSQEV